MREAAVVVGLGKALYWHLPIGRTASALPDSQALWAFLWDHRSVVEGVAHSHPGKGDPHPSMEDLTTFSALELGLGRRLSWWITSEDRLVKVRWVGPDTYAYRVESTTEHPEWLDRLRTLSKEDSDECKP